MIQLDLKKFEVQSTSRDFSRKVWFHPSNSGKPHPLFLFLDAEIYLQRIGVVAILERLLNDRLIPEASFVFVSNENAAARHTDYTCNEDYAKFIVNDVFNWAKQQNPAIQSSEHFICGLSLSGLQSTFIALKHPHLFTYCLSQSGSFWYETDKFCDWVSKSNPAHQKFWLSVGGLETDINVTHPPTGLFQKIKQTDGVEQVVASLSSSNALVRYHLFHGGHDVNCWEKELPDALKWLLS